jgi:putative ABC transport system permease protein
MAFYLTAFILGLAFVPLAIGIFLSVKIFNIPDITTDGSYTLGAAITGVLTLLQIHPILIMLAVLFTGAVAGSCTGLIHTKLKVNALLSGILVMTALYSVNLLIMGKSNIPLINTTTIFNLFFSEVTPAIQLGICLLFCLMLVLLIGRLLKTDFGITMRATGNNENMVTAQGVNVDNIKIIGLAISNALVALSGYLITQIQGFADINMGIGIVIAGLASVMIGEAFASKIKSRSMILQLLMVVIGTILFRLLLAFVLAQGIDQVYLKLLTAAIVLVILTFTKIKWRTN